VVKRVAAALTAALLAGAAASADDIGPAPPLALTWHDPQHALPFSDRWVADDLRDVLASAGVTLAWARGGEEAAIAGSQFRVVLLASESAGLPDVMGSVKRGSLSRTAWINLPAVKRTLHLNPLPGVPLAPEDARALSRALARVIAHEVVHLAAPDLPHTRGGLMAARLGRSFLTGPRAALSPAEATALRAAASGDTLAGGSQMALSQP
jgi:hypothetical protein